MAPRQREDVPTCAYDLRKNKTKNPTQTEVVGGGDWNDALTCNRKGFYLNCRCNLSYVYVQSSVSSLSLSNAS